MFIVAYGDALRCRLCIFCGILAVMAIDSDIFNVTNSKPSLNLDDDYLRADYLDNKSILDDSLHLAHQHYENFPVASFVLPKHLREPISLIYTFARQADDFADEGHHKAAWRLAKLHGFKLELDLIRANSKTKSPFFNELGNTIRKYNLPLEPFYDLLDARRCK
jgi:hypothetical protein